MLNKNEIIDRIQNLSEKIFNEIGFLSIVQTERDVALSQSDERQFRSDLVMRVKAKRGKTFAIIFEVKSAGQPRYVRLAASQLKEILSKAKNVYGVIGAPFLSDESKNICVKEGLGYMDLAGNCRFQFNSIYVLIDGKPNPYPATRPLKSIFSPKSTRALRILLLNLKKSWQVIELAKEAKLSLGQTSNIKKRLLDFEWIQETDDGKFRVSDPERLLNNWSENYSYRKNKIYSYYSLDKQEDFEKRLTDFLDQNDIRYAFTLTSGAARVAPLLRSKRIFVYIEKNIEDVARELNLKTVPSGANVVFLEPYDEGVFYGCQKINGEKIVSDVQLYLDLKSYKERGEEAADFILNERLRNKW
jgi:hypothetical protein